MAAAKEEGLTLSCCLIERPGDDFIVIIVFDVIITNHNDGKALSQDHDGLAARQGPTS